MALHPHRNATTRPQVTQLSRTLLVLCIATASAACETGDLVLDAANANVSPTGQGKGKGGNPKAPESPTPLVSVTFESDSATLDAIGASVQLEATVRDADGELTTATLTWSSLNPGVAVVDEIGNVTSRAVGIALITAATGGAADTASVAVRQVITSVAVTAPSTVVEALQSIPLTATAFDANHVVVSDAEFAWTSSSPAVAAVDSAGVVRGIAAGASTITATVGDHLADAEVTVTDDGPAAPSTWIYPGDDIQQKVSSHPTGTMFLIKAGVHRMQQISPRDGQHFVGEAGAVLNGARLLTSFTRQGGFWVASGQTQQGQVHGNLHCLKYADGTRYDACGYPEDLFIDDRMLWQVTSLAQVKAGTWYFDYGADKIYFADDPAGRKVETSVTRHAFTGNASGVTIRGLTVEKYANPAQNGAIHGTNTRDWIVTDNVVQLNHGVGIRTGERMQVRNNKILRNGQLGIGGSGDDVLVEGNQIAHNHAGGFNVGWEAGGSKFVRTHRLTVRANHVHDNDGPGLWTDIDNIHTLYERNRVEDNTHAGIFHEISYDAVIRDNIVRRNGLASNTWLWGAGILVAGSSNVEVYGNLVEENGNGIAGVQQNRGTGAYGPWKLRNLWVHHNTVRMVSIGRSGVARDDGDPDVYAPAGNNRFDHNDYTVGTWRSTWFMFNHGNRTWVNWRSYGHDLNGSLRH